MNCKGQVLLEAIAATVIISISLTLIMQSLLSSYRSVNLQKDYTEAIMILEDHLSKISFDGEDLQDSQMGHVPSRFQYQGAIADIDENLKNADLLLQWPSGQRQRQLHVATFVYQDQDENQTN